MSTAESVKAQLNALLNQANDTTGKTDENLTAAIASLAAGFGQGGGNAVQIGQETPAPNFMNLFYALEQGTAVTGTFTLASPLSGETLIFSSGLPALNGILLVNTDRTEYAGTNIDSTFFSVGLFSDGELMLSFVLSTSSNTGPAKDSFIRRGTWRIDGGDLYVTPDYNNHNLYTPFRTGETHRWVAW